MTFEKIKKDMYTAMKSHDKLRKDVLSTFLDNAKKMAIDKREDREHISEEIMNAVILKEKKTMEEMIDSCPNTPERANLKHEYIAKLYIIYEYTPRLINNEITIREMINKSGIEINKENRGKMMGVLKGKCDMKIANQVVSAMIAEIE